MVIDIKSNVVMTSSPGLGRGLFKAYDECASDEQGAEASLSDEIQWSPEPSDWTLDIDQQTQIN